MKKSFAVSGLIRMLGLAAVFVSAHALMGGGLKSVATSGLKSLSYRGEVAGELVVDAATLTLTGDAEARITSTHLGRGVQLYLQKEIFVVPMAIDENGEVVLLPPNPTGLATFGVAHSVAANGDVLDINFALYAPTALDGLGQSVAYFGGYRVLPTGTGRFAYPADAGSLGDGIIQGTAALVPGEVPGTMVMKFAHTFEGTLAESVPPRRSDAN